MLNPVNELTWIEQELDKLSDKIFILKKKPYELIEHRLHMEVILHLSNIFAAAKNLESALALKDFKREVI